MQPCVFTEEEFDKVIKHSERSGNATPAEIKHSSHNGASQDSIEPTNS